ncbi:MAG: hypothetical protein AAFX02_11610 [Pseudomonadota bacterium]
MQVVRFLKVRLNPINRLTGLLFGSCAAGRLAHSQTDEQPGDFERAHEALTSDPQYQFDRPFEPVVARQERETPDWLENTYDFFGNIFSFIADRFDVIGPVLLIIVIAFVVVFILREMGYVDFSRFFTAKKTETVDAGPLPYRPDQEVARMVLGDADTLAAEGRFEEAVHALLYRSIEDIRAARGDVEAFLTSREIGLLNELSPGGRQALGRIIQLVEGSFFGGRALGADGWHDAREAYEAFAFGDAF